VRVAVTGARGRVGGEVVRLLTAAPDVDVLALTRAVADYDDGPALLRALAGVETLVLVSSDGESDRVLQHHLNLAGAVAVSTVSHVVLLSSVDRDVDSPFCYARVNGLTEQALATAADAVTVVRASIYAEFFAVLLDGASAGGELRVPAADARVSLVARDDVAGCLAACALRAPSGTHEVTGPVSWSMDEVAAARGMTYSPVSEAEFAAEVAHRETPWWAYAYTSMFASIRERRWEAVSDGVDRLTGRAAATVRLG